MFGCLDVWMFGCLDVWMFGKVIFYRIGLEAIHIIQKVIGVFGIT